MDEASSQVALITSGSGSIARAIAADLARLGWSIFLQHDGDEKQRSETAEAIKSQARQADKQQVDVACAAGNLAVSADREQLVESAIETFGRIDMLINAAGHLPPCEDLLEVTEQAYRQVLDNILNSAFFTTQLVASEMVRLAEAGEIENPKIVTINSIGAYTTSSDHGPHCLGRAALSMMTRLFADRLAEHGINVYEVRAGIITTGAADAVHARYDELIEQGLTPIRRWGRPQDIARAVVAIAQELLPFSTGEVINVDGGFHLRRL